MRDVTSYSHGKTGKGQEQRQKGLGMCISMGYIEL